MLIVKKNGECQCIDIFISFNLVSDAQDVWQIQLVTPDKHELSLQC